MFSGGIDRDQWHEMGLCIVPVINFSALSEAAAGGDVATIMFFVQHGVKINAQGQFNRTPIYRASFGGHVDAVKVWFVFFLY